MDPETAAQLDAADSEHDVPSSPASEPDEMSRVIEEHDDAHADPETGRPAHPDSLADGAEW